MIPTSHNLAILRLIASVILVGLVTAVLFVTGVWISTHFAQKRALAEAKAYPALIEPLLEAYRQKHGTYPTSLDQLSTQPALPQLLRGPHSYRSDGTSYSFSFLPPGYGLDAWDYLSITRKWHTS